MSYFDYPEGSNNGKSRNADNKQSYIMEDMDASDWKVLLDYMNIYDFPEDEVLIGQDAQDRSIFIMLRGEAIVVKNYPVFGQRLVNYITAGQVFGEIAFFNNMPRVATVIATEKGQYIKINFDAYLRLVSDHSVIAHKLVMGLSLTFAARNRYAQQLLGGAFSI